MKKNKKEERYWIEAHSLDGKLKFTGVYENEKEAKANFRDIIFEYPACKLKVTKLADVFSICKESDASNDIFKGVK